MSRLLQVALAVYLLPALLMVLAVGGCGMLLVAIMRLLAGIGPGQVDGARAAIDLPASSTDLRLDDL